MKTLEEVLDIIEERVDRATLEDYIARQWLRPVSQPTGWHFEEIDIARLQLVCYLQQDIAVNEEGMDVALSLLDQLYGVRAHMQKLTQAISQQPESVQANILSIVNQINDTLEVK